MEGMRKVFGQRRWDKSGGWQHDTNIVFEEEGCRIMKEVPVDGMERVGWSEHTLKQIFWICHTANVEAK